MQQHILLYHSPIGTLEIQGTEQTITSVTFVQSPETVNQNHEGTEEANPEPGTPEVVRQCVKQLDEYFQGTRTQFSVPMLVEGTPFEKLVWAELQRISFGSTASYAEVATRLGNRRAIRAVGSTASKNKLMLFIPCHRMIGSNGTMTGYAGGVSRKEWLLRHEAGKPEQPTLF